MKKRKILMLADNPLKTSGVGCQGKHLIEGLIKKGRWSFRVFGGAIRHENYDTRIVNDDFIVKPVDGFGNPEMLRNTILMEKPDALFLFTDPRFFIWVWEMEEEIHQVCPIVYWHVWDNEPYPKYNDVLYQSTDLINCHSYLTYSMLAEHFPEKTNFIPHTLPRDHFFHIDREEALKHRDKIIGPERRDHLVCIWVNRNARRKMPGNVMLAWKQFLDKLEEKHGHRKATLLMHTAPHDPEGQNLPAIADSYDIKDNVVYSTGRIGFDDMCILYNISDFCMNIACFPAGELVMTRDGMQEIQDIEVGTEVLTHRGRYRPVKNVWRNPRQGRDVYIVKSANNPHVRVTGNHKVKAIRRADLPGGWLWNENMQCALDYVADYHVEDLAVGDYVVQFTDRDEYLPEGQYHEVDLWDVVGDERCQLKSKSRDGTSARFLLNEQRVEFNFETSWKDVNRECVTSRTLTIDEDIAYFIGRWNADGTSGSTSIIFNGGEAAAREKVEGILTRHFGGFSHRHRNDHAGCIDVIMRGAAHAVMTSMLEQCCGRGSEFKRVPEFIFTSSEPVRRAYLEGHFGGDGCELTHPTQGNRKKRIRTISNSLARGLKRLLVGLGYVPFVKCDKNGGWGKKPIWTIEWREGGQHNGSSRMWNVNGKALVSRIYSHEVDETCTDDVVYTLEVEEDHWYTTSAFSAKNCHEGFGLATLEAMQCGLPIVALKTGGLTRQVVDHRDGSENGIALTPEVRDLVGGQLVPYIYEDHIATDTVAEACMKMYEMGEEERTRLGLKARDYVLSEFDIDHMVDEWDRTMGDVIDKWKKDKPSIYKPWEVTAL